MYILFVIAGLIGLWLGTKWIINSAIGIAERFNLSHSFVGIAIIAVGTDIPEVFVSVDASLLHLKGIETSGIITGNAIGSSICQITFILGISSLLFNYRISGNELLRNGLALFTSLILLFSFGTDGIISRIEGILLVTVYILYYLIMIRTKKDLKEPLPKRSVHSNMALLFFLISGFIVLIFSSKLVVNNALVLAKIWGVKESFVGIAIVGLGTSLPELAVTIGAAYRKSSGMSVGNIIGSNVFDGFIPIGVGGSISTIHMGKNLLRFDLPFLAAVTLLALLFLRSPKGLSKAGGFILITGYVIYLTIKWETSLS